MSSQSRKKKITQKVVWARLVLKEAKNLHQKESNPILYQMKRHLLSPKVMVWKTRIVKTNLIHLKNKTNDLITK